MTDKDRDSATNKQDGKEPYEKTLSQQSSGSRVGGGMQTNRSVGSVGGGVVPSSDTGLGSDEPRGGMNTSNSTVSAGGTMGGGNTGGIAQTDRGSTTSTGMTMNTGNSAYRDARNRVADEVQVNSQQSGGKTGGHKGSSPLSREEANKIDQDAKRSPDSMLPNDIGHEEHEI